MDTSTIKKLAEQAGYTEDSFGVGHWDMPECKKFAELIIKECTAIINHGMDHTDYPEDPEKSMVEIKTLRWCRSAIKEHFGVIK